MSPLVLILFVLLPLLLSAAITAAGCWLLRPLLVRYALARPNARSSHKTPTPQGGGIPILIALAALTTLAGLTLLRGDAEELVVVTAAAGLLGLVGGWDDLRPLPALLRLVLQGVAVAAVILLLPAPRLLPLLPPGLEQALLILAGVWFVNLTNFMDGLDWITVAGFAPMTAFLALLALAGAMTPAPVLIAATLCGALLGFAPFNKPAARLFLGDVGSLPIGLLAAYLLHQFAGVAGLAPALILPFYHVADATLTLFRRLARRERVWEAHRSHFYQQATDNGFTVREVSGHVLALNLVLCGLAAAALFVPRPDFQLGALALAGLLTSLLLRRFSRPRAWT